MTRPTVSVVVPTKDRCAQLATTLAMVLDQTVEADEVLVVVDGSSDRTVDYLTSLGHPRVHAIVHDTPSGVAAARNRGIAQATGDWVAFTDDDDLWAPRKLELQLEALAANPGARWSTTTCVSVDTSFAPQLIRRAPDAGHITPGIYLGNTVPGGGSGVVADRALLDEVGGFDTELSILADWDLWIRLAARAPQAPVTDPTVLYMLHSTNMSNDMAGCLAELDRMADKYAEQAALPRPEQFGIETRLWIARALARSGRRREAAEQFLDAARRGRRPSLVAHAGVAWAGPWARRALDRSRAWVEQRRGGRSTRALVADLRWRAGLSAARVAEILDRDPGSESPEVVL